MSRSAKRVFSSVLFTVALAFAASAWAAYDAFITGISGNQISCRKAGGEQISFLLLDPTAVSKLAVGQKLTIDEATGKASMQDFHFTVKMNTASPKLFTGGIAPAPTQPRQVMINGKLLTASARVVNGKVFVPLEDFSRALGGNGITLDTSLKLNFPTLSSIGGAGGDAAYKPQSPAYPVKWDAAQKVSPGAVKITPAAQVKMGDGSVRGLQVLSLNRGGVISSQLQKFDGKVFVPLNDILIGLGQRPGAANLNSMSLNFTVPAVQNSIIGVL